MSKKLRFAIPGADTVVFCPQTIGGILVNKQLLDFDLELRLMNICEDARNVSAHYAQRAIAVADRAVELLSVPTYH